MPGPDRRDLIGRVDVEHWQHITGTVHMATRRLPSWPDLDHTVDGSDRPQFTGGPVQTGDFTAKQVQPPIAPEAIATDPASLTAQLNRLRHSTGTTSCSSPSQRSTTTGTSDGLNARRSCESSPVSPASATTARRSTSPAAPVSPSATPTSPRPPRPG